MCHYFPKSSIFYTDVKQRFTNNCNDTVNCTIRKCSTNTQAGIKTRIENTSFFVLIFRREKTSIPIRSCKK